MAIIAATRRSQALAAALRRPRALGVYAVAALLIGVNWLTYVWAVNSGHIIETSLGYFISPLFSVVLGVMFLRERLRVWQWLPLGLATLRVAYLTVNFGSPPWIALILASTWGVRGLVKKLAPLGSVEGLTAETGLLLFPALSYLWFVERTGSGVFLHTTLTENALLIGAGLATTTPRLLFAAAAQRIPLSLVGILQYVAPTIQFLLGWWVYGEPFTTERFIGFALVWAALVVFGVESYLTHRTRPLAVASD